MKRRFAYNLNDNYEQIRVDEVLFKGYACYLKLQNIEKPLIVNNGKENICIRDNNYEWIEVYPENGKSAITIMYDDRGNLIEWYFDVSKKIGVENGIPYEDDLYLDMIITPNGEKIVIDEDELLEALQKGDITQEDVNDAYNTLRELENKYVNNMSELIKLTNYLLSRFKDTIQLVPYTESDYEFVYEVKKNAYKKYVEECWGSWVEEDQRKYFEKFITTVKDNAFIIMDGDKKIGFYNGEVLENGNYEIGNICIIPEYQGKGIGTKILKDKIEENKDRDIEIQYFKQNPVGSLYARLGFVPNGETEFHYQMKKLRQNTLKK